MCGMIVPILAVVASGLSAASSIQASKAARKQSKYQAELAAFDAKERQSNAEKIRENTNDQEAALRRAQAQELGAQRSLLASQGYSLSDVDGSAAVYLGQEQAYNEADALQFREDGEYRAWQEENAAYTSQARSNQAISAGERAKTSSLLNLGKSAVSMGTNVANAWYAYV